MPIGKAVLIGPTDRKTNRGDTILTLIIPIEVGHPYGRKPENLSRKPHQNICFQKQCGDIKPEGHVLR